LFNPFPEEANRMIAGCLARWHFAPTVSAKQNLLRSGVRESSIFVSGNSVIDALLETAKATPALPESIPSEGRLVLITAHRRESFGKPFQDICTAIVTLARRNPRDVFLYPVHPNPNVRKVVYERLSGLSNVVLSDPFNYQAFVAVMKRAHLIITDSGGVQEEAPALGKPVLVLRNETERPEAVDAGVARLVGTDPAVIVQAAEQLLRDPVAWRLMARGASPYGDGRSAARIVARLRLDLDPECPQSVVEEFAV
jgi:UDP-N-acetylglucosamine 2-epimerase (non-hydrolysing)